MAEGVSAGKNKRATAASLFRLTVNAYRKLQLRARRAQNSGWAEVCGLLAVDRKGHLELLFVPNRAGRAGGFEIAHADERRLRRPQGALKVVGSFHSHPLSPAVPSDADISRARYGHLLLIYDVCGREAKLWRIRRLNHRKTATELALKFLR